MSVPSSRAAQRTPSENRQTTATVRSTGVQENNLNFTEEANRHEIGSWDQFKANDKLIQATSNYDELKYTTSIPQHIPQHWAEKSEKAALSIEKNPTADTGQHKEYGEEATFASVQRNKSSD